MKRIMVRYKVKPDRVAENENLIEQVFEQLSREKPAGVRYAAFKLTDGASFIHIVSIETPDGSNPLMNMASFRDFVAQIRERCVELPVPVELIELESYHFFGH
jgi:hypothetical protein